MSGMSPHLFEGISLDGRQYFLSLVRAAHDVDEAVENRNSHLRARGEHRRETRPLTGNGIVAYHVLTVSAVVGATPYYVNQSWKK